jgi:hypothetical protein
VDSAKSGPGVTARRLACTPTTPWKTGSPEPWKTKWPSTRMPWGLTLEQLRRWQTSGRSTVSHLARPAIPDALAGKATSGTEPVGRAAELLLLRAWLTEKQRVSRDRHDREHLAEPSHPGKALSAICSFLQTATEPAALSLLYVDYTVRITLQTRRLDALLLFPSQIGR